MAADYSRVDAEIERGRLWRAKEMLVGRLAGSSYDAELFGRLACVLEAMHDDDEAGRFHLLSDAVSGTGESLANKFLARRKAQSLLELWATMPNAARRRLATTQVPSGTVASLVANGLLTEVSQLPIAVVVSKAPGKKQSRVSASRAKRLTQNVIAWSLIMIVALILVLGFAEAGRLLNAGILRLFAS